MLKLKLQYFGHLMWRVDSLEKTLILGGIGAGGEGDDRGWDGWMALPTQWTWVWVNSGNWWWMGRPGVLQFMGSQRVGHDWATELNWTEWEQPQNSYHSIQTSISYQEDTMHFYNFVSFNFQDNTTSLVLCFLFYNYSYQASEKLINPGWVSKTNNQDLNPDLFKSKVDYLSNIQ